MLVTAPESHGPQRSAETNTQGQNTEGQDQSRGDLAVLPAEGDFGHKSQELHCVLN